MNLKCVRLDNEGRGICLDNGKVVFVNGILPGEEGIIEITLSKRNYSVGKLIRLTKRSSLRVQAKCVYKDCGCNLNILSYEDQLKYKVNIIDDLFKRNGFDLKIDDIIFDKNIYKYRNKITLKVRGNRVGYYHFKSNDFFPINGCLLLSDKVNKLIGLLNKIDLMDTKEIIIKEFNGIMVVSDGMFDYKKITDMVDSIYINEKLIYGKEFLSTDILGKRFIVSYSSFFQVNRYMIDKLYGYVLDNELKGEILDLYCGTGTISILSSINGSVTGIEINPDSIRCALKNNLLNGTDVKFILGDALDYADGSLYDTVIVDPPRSGLKRIESVLGFRAKRLIYVSCNPITLIRDLKVLKNIYEIKSIRLFDMFPNTYHVETVAILDRLN